MYAPAPRHQTAINGGNVIFAGAKNDRTTTIEGEMTEIAGTISCHPAIVAPAHPCARDIPYILYITLFKGNVARIDFTC